MPIRRHGRAAPLRGSAGLIVCVACAVAAAGPTLVPPDEAAALSPVASGSYGRLAAPEDFDSFPRSAVDTPPTGLCLENRRDEGGRGGMPRIAAVSRRPTDLFPPLQAGSDPFPEFPNAGCPACDDENEIGFRVLDPVALFTDGLAPVVRSQSPEIELLPLAGGGTPIENTSLLSLVTGTEGRIRGDYLTDFDETDRIGVQALTKSWLGFGFDAEANYWRRPVAGLGREPLWTGDLNLIYNLVPHPRFKFRSGLGAAWTLEDGKPHAGYNVTHGLDVYLLWRAMAIGEIDWGRLDDDKLFRYRLALGITYQSFELFSGYESYKLGSERLDGWVNGVAWWY